MELRLHKRYEELLETQLLDPSYRCTSVIRQLALNLYHQLYQRECRQMQYKSNVQYSSYI